MKKLETIIKTNKDDNLLLYSKYEYNRLYIVLFKDEDILYLKKIITSKKRAYIITKKLYNFIKEEININKINIKYPQNNSLQTFEAIGIKSKILIKNINPQNFLS